jgi:hypothetical protein
MQAKSSTPPTSPRKESDIIRDRIKAKKFHSIFDTLPDIIQETYKKVPWR